MVLRQWNRTKSRAAVTAVVLLLAVAAAYRPLWGNGFVSYDDPDYIIDNPSVRAGLTLKGVAWAITTFHAGNWHPLTWLGHMATVSLFGLDPAGHHGVS